MVQVKHDLCGLRVPENHFDHGSVKKYTNLFGLSRAPPPHRQRLAGQWY